jgi:hypothetical protein
MVLSVSSGCINHLIFLTVKCGVLFEVRNEFLNIIYTSFIFKVALGGLVVSVFSIRPKVRVNTPASYSVGTGFESQPGDRLLH